MKSEYIFDICEKNRDDIKNQILESEKRIPGLIFNYPPISVWDLERLRHTAPVDIWEGSDTFSHNIYIHIPFCRQKCSFCYYSVAVKENDHDLIWHYLKCLEKEALRYVDVLGDKRVDTVFVGGGTPSRLSEDQMEFLYKSVIGRFNLSACREMTYECSPDSITASKMAVLKNLGFNRLSMGVQSLDPDTLQKARRENNPDKIINTYFDMVDSGIPNVNIDLIAGIEREDFEKMRKTMDTVMALPKRPTQITLFTLSIREGAINHVTMKADSPFAIFEKSLELYRYAKSRMFENGYWQYSRNLFPTENWIYYYQDNHWGNNGYVLALGASGYSHAHKHTYINEFNYLDYMKKIELGASTVQKSFALSPEESMRRHVALAMKHKKLDKARFNSFYPEAEGFALAAFDEVFEALEELGVVTITDDAITYSEEAIDVADRYTRLFYSKEVNNKIEENERRPVSSKGDSFKFTI